MRKITGHHFDGLRPIPIPASLELDSHLSTLTKEESSSTFQTAMLTVSPGVGGAKRFINFPDGSQFYTEDTKELISLKQQSSTEGPIHYLEKRWYFALLSVAIVVIALLWGYFKGLPILASRISYNINPQTERSLGTNTLLSLDQFALSESQASKQRRVNLQQKFDKLIEDLPSRTLYQLEFRKSKMFGPNAFALPGGIIIVLDSLLDMSSNDEEVIAILAHEVGHQELHHTLKSLIQNSAAAAVVAAVTSDASMVGGFVSSGPLLLAKTKYSREFEAAADDYGFALLKKHGYSPRAFAAIMQRFLDQYGKAEGRNTFLSTHPQTSERIESAVKAAGNIDQTMNVSDQRMAPALTEGTHVVFLPTTLLRRAVTLGDIVLVETKEHRLLIKRILGFPTDRIEIRNHKLYRNGSSLARKQLSTEECSSLISKTFGSNVTISHFGNYQSDCYYELSGKSKYIVISDLTFPSAEETRRVPANTYFVINDNRMESRFGSGKDSEDPDFVETNSILGVLK